MIDAATANKITTETLSKFKTKLDAIINNTIDKHIKSSAEDGLGAVDLTTSCLNIPGHLATYSSMVIRDHLVELGYKVSISSMDDGNGSLTINISWLSPERRNR